MVFWNKDLLFCDISPTCYAISLQKEIIKRHIKDFKGKQKFSNKFSTKPLPNLISSESNNMIKRSKGVNLESQYNKAHNIDLACQKINSIIIEPGEIFSFWKLVGRISEKKGYKTGRVIEKNKLVLGIGGGICNLANTINLLIIHSPLEIIEFHKHSDALAPDEGERRPLSAGTSVSYNNLDYRFKNTTDQRFQLLLWCKNNFLYAELRSEYHYPVMYKLVEEDHYFYQKNKKYYRHSKIYCESYNDKTDKQLGKELIWDNNSEVMFDYALIPKNQIKN